MSKKLLMGLALLIAIGTSAVFAQRVGEIVQFGGQPYVVESNSGGKVVLNLALNGVWEDHRGRRITISGSTAVFSRFEDNPHVVLADAIKKGYWKLGDQFFRNLTSIGNLTWSGQISNITSDIRNPNVATGVNWQTITLDMSADGKTFTDSVLIVWTRR